MEEARSRSATFEKITNMDQLIDLRKGVMEYITRFKERRIEGILKEAIEDLEKASEAKRERASDEESKRQRLESIFVDLVRKIRQRRCPQMAQKIMIMLIQRHKKRQEMQEELLAQVKERDTTLLKEAIKKLELANEVRKKDALEKESKRRMIENVFVDLVRKIRQRRNPQMAQKIMIKLLENQDNRQRMHNELIAKTTAKEQRNAIMKQIQRELLDKVQRRQNMKVRAKVLKEMMDKVKEWKTEQIKNSVSVDITNSQIEKPEDDDDFLPRKLFFFGIETFSVQPQTHVEAKTCIREMVEDEKEIKDEIDNGHQCPPPKKSKVKTTSTSRWRKFFGLK